MRLQLLKLQDNNNKTKILRYFVASFSKDQKDDKRVF